jgi:chemotaxis regulatin CheY-phosphate phosphatase CheZ
MKKPAAESESSTKVDDQALHRVYNLTRKISTQLLLLSDSPEAAQCSDLYKQPETSILSYIQKLSANSTSQILDKLESMAPIIETSTKQCDELRELIKAQQGIVFDTLEEEKSTQENLLSGLELQRKALATMHENHLDILLLHSYQDLVSQATIRAVAAVDIIKQDLGLVETTLEAMQDIEGLNHELAVATADNTNADSDQNLMADQLGQADVDSIFASIRQNG